MEDNVTKFGELARYVEERVNKVELIMTLDEGLTPFLASKAGCELTSLEGLVSIDYPQPGINITTTLFNLAEVGMLGHHYMRKGIKGIKGLAKLMTDLYARKNRDYGNSFDLSMDKFGLVVAAIRIGDKVNRLQSLVKKGEAEVKDESLADTFLDLACYAIMTLMWLDNRNKKEE